MTSETRRVVDLDDIASFILECKNPDCLASITVPASKGIEAARFSRCPMCFADWVSPPASADQWVRFTHLVEKIAERNRESAFSLRLGLAGDVCEDHGD